MSPHDDPLRPAVRGALFACALLFVALGAWNSLGRVAFFIDDAYISLRYAWNLAFHGELTFNLGERVEGFSNPTFTLALAPLLWLGVNGRDAAQALGLACQLLTIVSAVWLSAELARPRSVAGALVVGASGALVAVSLPLAFWATGGLETPMVCMFLVASLAAALAERRDPGRLPVSALLAGLFAISRPETPLLAFGVVIGRAIDGIRARDGRGLLRWGAVFAVPTLGYLLFRLTYYGDIFPNTYYVKGGQASLDEVKRYVLPWAMLEPLIAAGGLLGLAALAWVRRLASLPLLWAALAGALFVMRVGGDYMPNARYLAPVLPLLSVGAASGAALLVERAGGWRAAGLAALWLGLVGAQGYASVPVSQFKLTDTGALQTRARSEKEWLPQSLEVSPMPGGVTMYLLQSVPPGAKLAHSTLGASGYLGDWVMLDLIGLTSRELSGATGLNTREQLAYIREQTVDWIVVRALNIGRFKKLRQEAWLKRYELWGLGDDVFAGRRKSSARITDEQILQNLSTACDRLPKSRIVCKTWADWALAVGDEAEQERACASLENTDATQRAVDGCRARMGKSNPRPKVEAERLTEVPEMNL